MNTGSVWNINTMVNKIYKFSANTVLVEQIEACLLWVVTTNLNGIRLRVCVCACVCSCTHRLGEQIITPGAIVRFLIFQKAAQLKR